jgi:lysozyme family protein
MATTFAARRKEYDVLWAGISLRKETEREVIATARQIVENKRRYEIISEATGVPWFVIGIIHSLECSLSFAKHLHNGDLMADKSGRPLKTENVPAGRGPFLTWDESAIDAIKYDKLDKETDWSVARIAWHFERFNGMGYANKGLPSPYLWSFTTAYESGKFVADGVYSPVAVSKQAGAMAILKALTKVDPEGVRLEAAIKPAPVEFPKAKAPEPPPKPPVKEVIKEEVAENLKSPTNAIGAGGLAYLLNLVFDWTGWLYGQLPEMSTEVKTATEPLKVLGEATKTNLLQYGIIIAFAAIFTVLYRNWMRKRQAKKLAAQLKELTHDEVASLV